MRESELLDSWESYQAAINSLARNQKAYNSIEKVNQLSIQWLRQAKKLIIWGLAFQTYDYELCHNIIFGLNQQNLERLIIINPNLNHSKSVAAFLQLSFDDPRVKYWPG
ncbi:MAG: hypothetical protein ACLGHN_10880 [Bacteriovoracia bacterium]